MVSYCLASSTAIEAAADAQPSHEKRLVLGSTNHYVLGSVNPGQGLSCTATDDGVPHPHGWMTNKPLHHYCGACICMFAMQLQLQCAAIANILRCYSAGSRLAAHIVIMTQHGPVVRLNALCLLNMLYCNASIIISDSLLFNKLPARIVPACTFTCWVCLFL